MSDLRSVLERGVEGIEPASDWFELVRRRARRRERARRLASGILALLIVAGAGTGLWAALRGHERSLPVTPGPSELEQLDNQIAALTVQRDQIVARLTTLVGEADKLHEKAAQINLSLVKTTDPGESARLEAQLSLVAAELGANGELIQQVDLQRADVQARLDQLLRRKADQRGDPGGNGDGGFLRVLLRAARVDPSAVGGSRRDRWVTQRFPVERAALTSFRPVPSVPAATRDLIAACGS